MSKLTKLFCFNILVLALAIFMAGCGATETKKAGNADNTKAANTESAKPAEEKPKEEAKTEVAASGDEIGVPECDEYVKKYEACVFDKVPEQMRGPLKASFETARKQWKEAAGNPQTKGTLASACKQAHDAAKQSMAAYKCDW